LRAGWTLRPDDDSTYKLWLLLVMVTWWDQWLRPS